MSLPFCLDHRENLISNIHMLLIINVMFLTLITCPLCQIQECFTVTWQGLGVGIGGFKWVNQEIEGCQRNERAVGHMERVVKSHVICQLLQQTLYLEAWKEYIQIFLHATREHAECRLSKVCWICFGKKKKKLARLLFWKPDSRLT